VIQTHHFVLILQQGVYRGPGQSPSRKRVLVHLELEKTHLMAINFVFLQRIFIQVLGCYCPGEHSPNSDCGRSPVALNYGYFYHGTLKFYTVECDVL